MTWDPVWGWRAAQRLLHGLQVHSHSQLTRVLAGPTPTAAQGSTGFREAVQQNLRWFEGARLVLISNTLWVGERLPCITCER